MSTNATQPTSVQEARETVLHEVELYVRRRDNYSGLSDKRWQKGIQYWRVTRALDAYALAVHVQACVAIHVVPAEGGDDSASLERVYGCGQDGWYCDQAPTKTETTS